MPRGWTIGDAMTPVLNRFKDPEETEAATTRLALLDNTAVVGSSVCTSPGQGVTNYCQPATATTTGGGPGAPAKIVFKQPSSWSTEKGAKAGGESCKAAWPMGSTLLPSSAKRGAEAGGESCKTAGPMGSTDGCAG